MADVDPAPGKPFLDVLRLQLNCTHRAALSMCFINECQAVRQGARKSNSQ
jgi:hypothetical protein